MQKVRNRVSALSLPRKITSVFLRRIILFSVFFCFFISTIRAETLTEHLKQFTSVLSSRNLDSLRLLIDPGKIYVEIAPKSGSYLSPSQTLAVVGSFFHSHSQVSFSYLHVKEEGKIGIVVGTLIVTEDSRSISRKVNFGFQKDNREHWPLGRISIR
jgi:hypothetical protein